MAHEVETMAYAGETPWHGLGKRVHHDLTAHQMLEEAGLNWKVYLKPTFAEVIDLTDPEGKRTTRISNGDNYLIRDMDNKILSTVSKRWEPVQNEEAAEFFHDFVQSGDLEMHTAGSLRGGNCVWMLARVKESFEAVKGDVVDSYVLFTNHHEYGKGTDIRATPIRVVCANTMAMALDGKSDFQLSQSHRLKFDVEKAQEALVLTHKKFAAYKEAAQFLASKPTKDWTKVEDYFVELFPSTRKNPETGVEILSKGADKLVDVYHSQPGLEFGEGTWWHALNTVTYYTDHVYGRGVDSRLDSAWYGENRRLKQQAMKRAVELAGVS